MTYSVVFEIEVDAETPLEAAKKVDEFFQDPKYFDKFWQFYVQGDDKVIHSVDLYEEDEHASIIIDDYTPLIQCG